MISVNHAGRIACALSARFLNRFLGIPWLTSMQPAFNLPVDEGLGRPSLKGDNAMCRLGKGLKSGKLPGVLYADGTAASKKMRRMLDSAGAKYELADAKKEAMPGPVLVVNGSFLDIDGVKEALKS